MILTIFLSFLAGPAAQASSASLVCRSADNSWTYATSEGAPSKVYRGGQLTNLRGEVVDEQDHDQNEGDDGACNLGRTSAQVVSTDHFKATLVVGGQRIPVSCENTTSARFDCAEEDLVN